LILALPLVVSNCGRLVAAAGFYSIGFFDLFNLVSTAPSGDAAQNGVFIAGQIPMAKGN